MVLVCAFAVPAGVRRVMVLVVRLRVGVVVGAVLHSVVVIMSGVIMRVLSGVGFVRRRARRARVRTLVREWRNTRLGGHYFARSWVEICVAGKW